jgi:hypothetical protein
MKFIFILCVLFLTACNPGGGQPTSDTATTKSFVGTWTSDDGNSRLTFRTNGTARLEGVCVWEWSTHLISYDAFDQGFIRLQGIITRPTGSAQVCQSYATGPGVSMQLASERLHEGCVLIDYGQPSTRFCRDQGAL